jgi:hypothetical protein
VRIDFKFTDRKELPAIKDHLFTNRQTILEYIEDSGLTHILKKLQIDLDADDKICFYLDCETDISLARQIVSQIVDVDTLKKYLERNKAHKLFERILSGIISGFDIIPFVSLGKLANDLFLALNKTIDVDFEHISDYKIDKAVVDLLNNIILEHPQIYVLFDNFGELKPHENKFVTKLLQQENIYTLFTISRHTLKSGIEIVSKTNSIINCSTTDIIVSRPDKTLTQKLFECYNTPYFNEYDNYFDRNSWNIHYIMTIIRGFPLTISGLNTVQKHIIKIMQTLETPIQRSLLFEIINNTDTMIIEESELNLDVLLEKNLFVENSDGVFINKFISDEFYPRLYLTEILPITSVVLNVFDKHLSELTIGQLQFAVNNLKRDYTRKKTYVLTLVRKLKSQNNFVDTELLDCLYSFDTIEELLYICSLYYNEQIYDAPYRKMKNHICFSKKRSYKILFSLICERIHKDNYYDALEKLINSSRNDNEAVLLVAVLFVAYLNSNKTADYQKILHDNNSKYYYEKYKSTDNYVYLLRNISFYLNDENVAIRNYEYCLNKFKNTDPVNYSRTYANFLNFLMTINRNQTPFLVEKAEEVRNILEYNDIRYIFLNISYGLYLMKYTNEDPSPYFDCIILEHGSLITPHIYARVNKAMYIVKHNNRKGLREMYKIKDEFYFNTNVAASAWDFYDINLMLAEYINGLNNVELLERIKLLPNRASRPKSEFLYSYYEGKFSTHSLYKNADWEMLFAPGFIFYRGFNAEKLIHINF